MFFVSSKIDKHQKNEIKNKSSRETILFFGESVFFFVVSTFWLFLLVIAFLGVGKKSKHSSN